MDHESVDWIRVFNDSEQWRAVVSTVSNILVHKGGEFLDWPGYKFGTNGCAPCSLFFAKILKKLNGKRIGKIIRNREVEIWTCSRTKMSTGGRVS
jgi:hypothetical protein